MADYSITVMRQYANSTTLLALLDSFEQWVDMDRFTEEFFFNVWDIDTATGFGLDIWGRILGRSRFLQVTRSADDNFGFNINENVGTQWQPFNQAPFWSGDTGDTVVSYALQDADYRQLLLIKAAVNIASCDCGSINSLMRAMYGNRGPCFVGYNLSNPMHIGYTFDFFPTLVEKAIIESGIFPCPAGMVPQFIYKTLTYDPFGFAGMNTGANPEYVTGFNQGPFYNP